MTDQTPELPAQRTPPEEPTRPPHQRPDHRRHPPQGNRPETMNVQQPATGEHPPRQPQRPQGQQQQQNRPMDLSVVIPLYNEEQSLRELYQQLRSVIGRMNVRYELLFIDDGSTDRSFQVLRDLRRTDKHIRAIRFRRNYGKSAALSVGFKRAQGSMIVTMDADLQDDPAEIPSLRRKLDEGYDLVSGWKKVRRDPITKTVPSRLFNFVTARMTGIKIHDFNCGLKAYRREVVRSINVYGELHRFIPALARWEGFRIGEIVVQHRPRKYGRTKFGVGRFWKGLLDLITVLFTTRYLRRPLHLFGFWGLLTALAGLVIIVWLAVEWFLGYTSLSNRPLFLGGILLLIVGVQFISIGLIGEIVSKTRQGEEDYSIRDIIT